MTQHNLLLFSCCRSLEEEEEEMEEFADCRNCRVVDLAIFSQLKDG